MRDRWLTTIVSARFFASAICAGLLAFNPSPAAAQQDPNVPSVFKDSFGKPGKGMFGNVNTKIDKAQPMRLQGDELIYDTSGNRVIARGNVEIFYNDYILTAEEVVYDQTAGTLTAVGNVLLKEPQGNVIRADRYTLTDDFRDGFVQSLSVVTRDDTRITAERATRREGNVTEFHNGKFTPCKSDGTTPPLWCISAARVVHDKAAQTITYQDATFDLFGQPIIYLPFFQHADPTVKRKSGFLMPEYGNSSNLGFIFGTPYYFALAPNYDFTFNPLYLSKQGVLWQGEWRHRPANGQYNVKIAGIDQDIGDLPNQSTISSDLDGWRGSIETHGRFSLSSWWTTGWDVILESDDEFRRFYKLDSILVTDRVNQVYLEGISDRNYFSARLYHFGGLFLTDSEQADSRAHPIIDHNYVVKDPVLGGELSFNSNVLSFSRDDGAQDRDQNITRLVTEAKWRRKMTDKVGITYTPFANLRGDVYQYDNFTDPSTIIVNSNGQVVDQGDLVGSDTTFRGFAAGGVTVAYPLVANSPSATHIIEPIGQIVTRQNSVTQDRLPNEDARSLVFDDTNLFEVSKFSGYDRTETGTRANVGVQYTFQHVNGGYARLLAGQSFHLAGENAYADMGRADDGTFTHTPYSGLESDRSDYVLGAYLAPVDAFRAISQMRFDQDDLTIRRVDAGGDVTVGSLYARAVYSFSRADPELGLINDEQEELLSLAHVQLTDNWSVSGIVRYDVDENRILSDALQVRYADECFALTATYSELYYESETLDDDRTVMFRFELKHIGEFAYKTNALDFAFGGEQRAH